MGIAFNCFPEIVKVDDGILNRQTLLTASLFCVQQRKNSECSSSCSFTDEYQQTTSSLKSAQNKQSPVLSAGNLLKPWPTCSGIAGTLKNSGKTFINEITQNTTWNKPVAFSLPIYLGLIDNISDLLLHVHHLFLIDKWYIFTWKLNNSHPVLQVYIQTVLNSMGIDKENVSDSNKISSF